MVRPITPDEIVQFKKENMPDAVIKEFNRVIGTNWNGHEAIIKQDHMVALIMAAIDPEAFHDKAKEEKLKQRIFNNHWLDVEDIYREAGWDVEYYKPGFNETGQAVFIFRRKGKRDDR